MIQDHPKDFPPTQQLVEAVNKLTQRLDHLAAMQNELWDADEIAAFLKLKKRSVQQSIINRNRNPSFPAPVILPTGGRRWTRQSVIDWSKTR